jgi:hypothetical protein
VTTRSLKPKPIDGLTKPFRHLLPSKIRDLNSAQVGRPDGGLPSRCASTLMLRQHERPASACAASLLGSCGREAAPRQEHARRPASPKRPSPKHRGQLAVGQARGNVGAGGTTIANRRSRSFGWRGCWRSRSLRQAPSPDFNCFHATPCRIGAHPLTVYDPHILRRTGTIFALPRY